MLQILSSIAHNFLANSLDLSEDTMIIIIVVVSIVAVSIIGAIFYAKKEGEE